MNATDSANSHLLKEAFPLLQTWYNKEKRSLPWRDDPTPYHVWISEIMLQQTRVEAVKPYYAHFLKRMPTIEALSDIAEEELLKCWEGLGYYSRARNLKKAATLIMENGGKMPSSFVELCKLPGIGSYTAGAIASIAFDQPIPAVDGNVLRIVMRLLASDSDIALPATKKRLETLLLPIMPKAGSGEINQAFMDLGATICLPNAAPKCESCPLADICKAHALGTETAFPKKSPKKPRRIEEKTIIILKDQNTIAFRKRENKGLLAGLYEFPWIEGHRSKEDVLAYLGSLGYKALRIKKLENAKHIFTHIEWHMVGYLVQADELAPPPDTSDFIFSTVQNALSQYPLPSAFSTYTKYINEHL